MKKIENLKSKLIFNSYNKIFFSKLIILIHIILGVSIWHSMLYGNMEFIEHIFSHICFIFLFFSYISFLVYKDRNIITRYCISMIVLSGFIILIKYNFSSISSSEILIKYMIQIITVFYIQDTLVIVLLQNNIIQGKVIKKIFYIIWIIGAVLIFLKKLLDSIY